MNSKPELRVDWCSFDAAKHAVENWHYSKAMPAGKLVKIGAWEDGQFIGCVLFGRGANNHIASAYALDQTQACELVRVALTDHHAPVSRILAIAIRMLKKFSPKLRLIISYADTRAGHHGGIYQATNWLYVGATTAGSKFIIKGRLWHLRSLCALYGTRGHSIDWVRQNLDHGAVVAAKVGKNKYLMPLDDEMRTKLKPLAKPYPKRVESSEAAPGVHPGEDGATPISTLQIKAGRAS